MIFYLIRHGDPIYDPDSLTPLGKRQAEAIGKRLAQHGLDMIFASPLKRAVETAIPASEMCKKEINIADWASESIAWEDFAIPYGDRKKWIFQHPETKHILASGDVIRLGEDWHTHPELQKYGFGEKLPRLASDSDRFFASLGYEHDRVGCRYKCVKPNDMRVALFAHQGFGVAFLSTLLDIPYPIMTTRFDIGHSDMTVIEFSNEKEFCTPKVLTLSNDSHLYNDGLPTKYNNVIYI